MKPFRFRMQAVLDLRRREHDQSQRMLARAESNQRLAEHHLAEAIAAIDRAQDDGAHALARPQANLPFDWYRYWIVGLGQQRDRCAQAVADRQRECDQARVEWWKTKRRVESMERLRDIQETRWLGALAAEEQKQMDALATMRFAARERTAP